MAILQYSSDINDQLRRQKSIYIPTCSLPPGQHLNKISLRVLYTQDELAQAYPLYTQRHTPIVSSLHVVVLSSSVLYTLKDNHLAC